LVQSLNETVTGRSASDAVSNHLDDYVGRAGVLDVAVLVASGRSIMILHESWIANTVVRGRSSNAAIRFLHHDGKDEAAVNASFTRNLLDSSGNVVRLLIRVCSDMKLLAPTSDDVTVVFEPALCEQ
jgi:hypothetical protein